MLPEADKVHPLLIASEDFAFPSPLNSDKQGLLAWGGDLSAPRLLAAYRQGIFPWFQPGNPILWWSPNPRLLLNPPAFKVSRSLQKYIKKNWRISCDTSFKSVIEACSTVDDRTGESWITKDMIAAYCFLHEEGFAHSVEVWDGNDLIGGLYGLSMGKAFFGESMFHYQDNASKVALYFLSQVLDSWKFDFIDCQLPTGHLLSLGADMVNRKEFLYRLQASLEFATRVGNWKEDFAQALKML